MAVTPSRPITTSQAGVLARRPGAQYNNHYTSTITNDKTEVSVTADAVKFGINYHLAGSADGLK